MTHSIWFKTYTLDEARTLLRSTLIDLLGIELTAIGDDFLQARMPVDRRTRQPAGILHGGASLVLAETLASLGANWVIDPSNRYCVCMEINANHLRQMKSGWVYGLARPLHLGRNTQVWEVRISDGDGRAVCISRATLAAISTVEK